jgi:hypothetical protein
MAHLASGRPTEAEQGFCRALELNFTSFASEDSHARQYYFKNQLNRYLVLLEILPGAAGQRLLEVGSSFHHLTPALKLCKGYDVTCTDLWNGPQQITRRLSSRDGAQSLEFCVDNFDVRDGRRPYLDASFMPSCSANFLSTFRRIRCV